jgi:flagellar basal body rod protein FlgG
MPTEEDFGKAWEKKGKEYFNKWQKSYKELNKDKTYIPQAELDEKYKKELSKPSKNDPSLTVEEWNKKQLEKEISNARQGLTAISFTPKGDKWFEATATDGKTRKIIPKTIYKNDKGELVKVEGYNVDESTDKIKIDLEEFEVDATNENNRNSFIGKYPTTVKSASLNVPTKVIVSGKQAVGTIQGKSAPKKEAAKPKKVTKEEVKNKLSGF